MTVLVTGGAGFVGSHQVVELVEAGHEVLIVDDGSNSDVDVVLDQLTIILGQRPRAEYFDVRDTRRLRNAIVANDVQAIVHLAAMKDLRESVERPMDYYRNNLRGLQSVIEAADASGVRQLVFSSSGSVYGNADELPITEDAPHRPTNPYSATKTLGERMLAELCAADPTWSVMALRYFNPAGAHPSGFIGESPTRRSTNLMPLLLDAAAGRRGAVDVFGNDFDTPDGTGVRDYIHVMDVAEAHLAALDHVATSTGFEAVNVGRGEGVSVRELIDAVERVTKRPVPFDLRSRRPGDVGALVGSTARAAELFGKRHYRSIDEIAADAWRWHCMSSTALPALDERHYRAS